MKFLHAIGSNFFTPEIWLFTAIFLHQNFGFFTPFFYTIFYTNFFIPIFLHQFFTPNFLLFLHQNFCFFYTKRYKKQNLKKNEM